MAISPKSENLPDRVAAVEDRLDEASRKTNSNFTVTTPSGVTVLKIGPKSPTNPTNEFVMRRSNGSLIMWTGTLNDGVTQFWAFYDRNQNLLFSDDAISGKGLAEPWMGVPMTPNYSMASSTVWQYMNLPVASVATETILWTGVVPSIRHGFMAVQGLWGTASGSNSSTFNLKLAGTTVGTWSETALVNAARGPFDVSAYLTLHSVTATITCIATGTGSVACDLRTLHLRGS